MLQLAEQVMALMLQQVNIQAVMLKNGIYTQLMVIMN